jgi:dsDNA-specific endonuclease/ATPase MutS2
VRVSTEEDDPVEVPVEAEIDLHSFLPSETASVVEEYLAEAAARGFREVRIVHGRGTGAQRKTIRTVLSRSPLVLEFRDAPPAGGGWGATVALLAPRDAPRP